MTLNDELIKNCDENVIRALALIQLNKIACCHANLDVIIRTVKPELVDSFKAESLFAMQEISHIVGEALGGNDVSKQM